MNRSSLIVTLDDGYKLELDKPVHRVTISLSHVSGPKTHVWQILKIDAVLRYLERGQGLFIVLYCIFS